ncbi:2OG-Fe(II) oxygenase [Xanthomonas sp. MUS 060]|uniref:2OG-Fe(II) oxygenase n=1 Tax=Xanthomonas sp. MUS 060 TaxID=1588031 RepID=UPI0009E62C57|nr:2OG-Fe(II) oxygenase [Xanthomonas sp. MUS 060]
MRHARTSSGCHFSRAEVALVANIEQRIAELTGIPVENGEGLQVLHYLPGQHYIPHWDYFPPESPSSANIVRPELGGQRIATYIPHWDYFPPESPSSANIVRPELGGQRIATFIAYLNTVPLGGETEFPRAGIKVAAVQGNACFFSYRTADDQPDPLTLHGGNAVIDGEKWIAVKWLREGRYPR